MAEAVAVRWPQGTSITPSILRCYQQCPRKTRFVYIDRMRRRDAGSVAMEAGKVAHSFLARCARKAQKGEPFLDEATCHHLVYHDLPRRMFSSDEEHLAKVRQVVGWIEYGLGDIDSNAEFLSIEQHEGTTMPVIGGHVYSFSGRPDLIQLRTDADGEMVVDFVDYKTGRPWPDDLTPLLVRSINQKRLRERFGSTSAVRMRWVWSWLNARQRTVIEMDRDYYARQWPLVSGEVKSLVTETEWPARPSKLCASCPYRGNPCREHGEAPEF